MLMGSGRYRGAGACRNDCSSAKMELNPPFEATDWSMCNAHQISTSGGGILNHWFRPSLSLDSYLPPGCKAVPNVRRTEVRLRSKRTAAASMKSGCAGATEVPSCSYPTSALLRQELHVGLRTGNRLSSMPAPRAM